MLAFLKYWPLILKFQDVSAAATDHYPDGKPFYLTQRFWGSVSILVFAGLGYLSIDVTKLGFTQEQLGQNLLNFADAVSVLVGTLYGLALAIKGFFDARKRKA